MADESKAAAKPAETAKKKSAAPLIVVLVVLLAGGAGAAWFFLHHGKTAEAAPEANTPEFVVHLDTFTVNLADPEEGHFLRITIDLGLGHPPKGAAERNYGDFPVARARDAILSVLTIGKADVLLTPDGKTQLKHDLIQSLQDKVPEADVRNVYFTEFIVQR
ncbi:MAG TPA: flagellar basal body-associated FliL family protein [Candidatus Acidoferrales bacterium]|nr:flagellar basal body-associated FliL family protein [Candidatus Acidoferrales bacterium]